MTAEVYRKGDFRWHRSKWLPHSITFEDLQAFRDDLVACIDADTRQVASGMREVCNQSCRDRVSHERDNRYRCRGRGERFDEIVKIYNDHLRVAANDGGERSKVLRAPLG
jgi:hypothetical protein